MIPRLRCQRFTEPTFLGHTRSVNRPINCLVLVCKSQEKPRKPNGPLRASDMRDCIHFLIWNMVSHRVLTSFCDGATPCRSSRTRLQCMDSFQLEEKDDNKSRSSSDDILGPSSVLGRVEARHKQQADKTYPYWVGTQCLALVQFPAFLNRVNHESEPSFG